LQPLTTKTNSTQQFQALFWQSCVFASFLPLHKGLNKQQRSWNLQRLRN
jgi:hypothetical protein